MNKFFAAGKVSNLAAWLIVLATLAQLCWQQARPASGLRALLAETLNPSSRQNLPPFAACDQIASQSGAGNMLIKLIGCTKPDHAKLAASTFLDYQEFYLSAWYFRISYDLYPRRAYLAPAEVIINNGWDMMDVGFVPDVSWLQSHDVRSVLKLGFDQHGRTLPVQWKQFPSKNAGGKTPTPKSGGE